MQNSSTKIGLAEFTFTPLAVKENRNSLGKTQKRICLNLSEFYGLDISCASPFFGSLPDRVNGIV